MKCSGKLLGVLQAVGTVILQLGVPTEVLEKIEKEKLAGNDLKIEIYRQNQKRSKNANGYYRQLIGQMARHLEISNDRMHNLLLRRYGTLEDYDGQLVEVFLPHTDEVEERILESEEQHWKPADGLPIFDNGMWKKPYWMIKGTRDYNTIEMSKLINGAVSEAQEMGIETMTPDEIRRMMEAYESAYQKHRADQND